MVSSSPPSGTDRPHYSKIGVDANAHSRSSTPTRSLLCFLPFLAASIAIALLLFLLLRPSHSPHPAPEHASPSPSLPQPPSTPASPSPSPSFSPQLDSLCNTTSYSSLCLQTLSSFPSAPSAPLSQLIALFASVALDQVNHTYSFALNFTRAHGSDPAIPVLNDCLELLDGGKDELSNTIDRLAHLDLNSSTFHAQVRDVQVWLSAAYTDQDTCSDGFQDMTGEVKDQVVQRGDLICKHISIALSLAETLRSSSHDAIPAAAPMSS